MDELSFTDEEVCRELAKFGYYNVPPETVSAFKRELEDIIKEERSGNSSLSTITDISCNQTVANDEVLSRRTTDVVRPASHFDSGNFHNPISREVDYSTKYSHSSGQTSTDADVVSTNHTAELEFGLRNEPDHSHMRLNSRSSGNAADVIGLKSCLKKPVPLRGLENENRFHLGGVDARSDVDDVTSVTDDSASQASSTGTERRVIKRKVLRKQNGRIEIHNESISENDSDLSYLGGQMRNLNMNVLNDRPTSAPPRSHSSDSRHHLSHAACREHLNYNLPDGYQGLKALIRPMSCEPHMRNIKKADPVSRYQKYRQSWNACKAPGERTHHQLRWDIREQMLQQDQVVVKRPQPVHQPNSYVVPGDKKRKTLRWQIRNDLAQGIKPPSVFD